MRTLAQLQNELKSEQGNLEALRLEVRDGWMLHNKMKSSAGRVALTGLLAELKSALAKSEAKVSTYKSEVEARLARLGN